MSMDAANLLIFLFNRLKSVSGPVNCRLLASHDTAEGHVIVFELKGKVFILNAREIKSEVKVGMTFNEAMMMMEGSNGRENTS